MLMTELTSNLQRAHELMHRHPGLSIGVTDGQIGLYEAREDGRVIGVSVRFGVLLDLLESAESPQ